MNVRRFFCDYAANSLPPASWYGTSPHSSAHTDGPAAKDGALMIRQMACTTEPWRLVET
jgi:hypothetical protein